MHQNDHRCSSDSIEPTISYLRSREGGAKRPVPTCLALPRNQPAADSHVSNAALASGGQTSEGSVSKRRSPSPKSAADLEDQVFLFPKRSASSYILLNPSQNREMESLTICLSFYSEMTQDFSLFSAASRDHDNEILLFKVSTGYEVILGNQAVVFKVSEERSGRQAEDLCLAWDSDTGIVQLWLNRIPLPRKVAAKSYRIRRDLFIMLGQDQDSYGGSLDPKQAFEGELGEVYLWDTVLTADQIRGFQRRENSVPLLDWLDLTYEIKGDVMAVPSLL